MNIVTIKAKARLAAKQIADHVNDYSENGIANIIESCFTPDSANNDDLIEALKALKLCKNIMCNSVMPLSGNTAVLLSYIYKVSKILAKYPNLK